MRDNWLDEHVGDEASVRPGFEADLADALHAAWHAPENARELKFARGGRRRAGLVAVWASVAAAALIVGVIALTGDDGKPQVTGSTSDLPSVAPTTSTPLTVTEPPSSTSGPATSVSGGSQVSLPVARTPEQQTVLDYLVALAESRWDDAAKLLGEGGLEWEGRADLRPLTGTDGALNDLPAALRDWCASPAVCQVPTSLATSGNAVVSTFVVDGVSLATVFTGGTFEGSPLVRGLPLRLPPPGVSLADTVPCPADGSDRSVYADLDGDGWDELVTLTIPTRTVTACGTTLAVSPLVVDGSVAADTPVQLAVVPGSAIGEAGDRLLVTFDSPDGFTTVIVAQDGRLAVWGSTMERMTERTSLGCTDVDGDGTAELVAYTFQYVGGSDLSNSTALDWRATELLPHGGLGPTSSGSLPLPAQEQQAFRIIAGYCGNLPLQTG